MRDLFGLPIRNQILSDVTVTAAVAFDSLAASHSPSRTRRLPRRIVGDGDADPARAELGDDGAGASGDNPPSGSDAKAAQLAPLPEREHPVVVLKVILAAVGLL
jgi:hypothetical protein